MSLLCNFEIQIAESEMKKVRITAEGAKYAEKRLGYGNEKCKLQILNCRVGSN